MNNKFDQFLADDEPQARSRKTLVGPAPVALGDGVSIKIRASTLRSLKLLKTIEGHRSYSEVMDRLLDFYIDHSSPDLKDKLGLLQD